VAVAVDIDVAEEVSLDFEQHIQQQLAEAAAAEAGERQNNFFSSKKKMEKSVCMYVTAARPARYP
jgi:hypothetical protein